MTPPDTPGRDDMHADLAEIALRVAREITFHPHPNAVSLTPANGNVMRYIDEHPGTTPSEVAEAVGLLRSNLSGALRELEKIEFIERRNDPADGRGIRLFPTDTSAQNLTTIRIDWANWVRNAIGNTSVADEATAIDVLNRLADGLVQARRIEGGRS